MASEESVILVDDQNTIVGSVPRGEMRVNKLCHRSTYVFVFNKENKLFVQERSLSKDIYPGAYAPSTGGVVSEGESYNQTAYRELFEELGIANTLLRSHFNFYFQDDNCKTWGRVYTARYDGTIILQKSEVARVVTESVDDILANRFNRSYTPCSLMALQRLMHSQKSAIKHSSFNKRATKAIRPKGLKAPEMLLDN